MGKDWQTDRQTDRKTEGGERLKQGKSEWERIEKVEK